MRQSGNAHLMIVEDEAPLRRMLVWTFEDLGYRVTDVACLSEARSRLQDQTIDGLLLDVHLPDGTAYDFLAELQELGRDMVVFLMSAALCDADRTRAFNGLVWGIFSKPIAVAELDRRLRDRLFRDRPGPLARAI